MLFNNFVISLLNMLMFTYEYFLDYWHLEYIFPHTQILGLKNTHVLLWKKDGNQMGVVEMDPAPGELTKYSSLISGIFITDTEHC